MDVLAYALTQCRADSVTGTLRIVGNPGGLFHFCDGAVIAVDSPGSPAAEALLMRTGRISEEDWSAALREGPGAHEAALVARGTVGPTELQVLAITAVRDGAFAVAVGDVEHCRIEADDSIDVLLAAPTGVAPDALLQETTRRLDALAALPFPVSPYRERVVPAQNARPEELTLERREILAHASGRRTARDIAFAVGRSVYPVTVEISRMLGDGLLEIAPAGIAINAPCSRISSLRPRVETGRKDADPGQLPARSPGRAMPEAQNQPRTPGWRALSRLFGLFDTERKHLGL